MKMHFQSRPSKPYTKNRLVRETNKIFREATSHALYTEDDATKSEMIEDLRLRIVAIIRQNKDLP